MQHIDLHKALPLAVFVALLLGLSLLVYLTGQRQEILQSAAPTPSMSAVMYTEARLAAVASDPNRLGRAELLARADANANNASYPHITQDIYDYCAPVGTWDHLGISSDAHAAEELALASRIVSGEQARFYSQRAAQIIDAWSTHLKDYDPRLDSDCFQTQLTAPIVVAAMINGADLLERGPVGHSRANRVQLLRLIDLTYVPARAAMYDCWQQNFASYATVFAAAAGAFMPPGDPLRQERLSEAYRKYEEHRKGQTGLASDPPGVGDDACEQVICQMPVVAGALKREVSRTSGGGQYSYPPGNCHGDYGIGYQVYTLDSMVRGAEILSLNGYPKIWENGTPRGEPDAPADGRTLELVWHTTALWLDDLHFTPSLPPLFPYCTVSGLPNDPERCPKSDFGSVNWYDYFEILQTRWPDQKAEHLITEGPRPRPLSSTFMYFGLPASFPTPTAGPTPTPTNIPTTSPTRTPTPAPSRRPYPDGSLPKQIPGTIQAEDYDIGGEGVSYHDTDAINQGGAYRADGVDIKVSNDSSL